MGNSEAEGTMIDGNQVDCHEAPSDTSSDTSLEHQPKSGRSKYRTRLLFAAALVLGYALYWFWFSRPGSSETLITELIETEEWIVAITPELKKLSHSVMNLRFPDYQASEMFAETVRVRGLRPDTQSAASPASTTLNLSVRHWPPARASRSVARDELRLWGPLMGSVEYFERARFYFVDAHQVGTSGKEIAATVGFEAVGRSADRHLVDMHAKQHVVWRHVGASRDAQRREGAPEESEQISPLHSPRDWQIVAWEQKSLSTTKHPGTMFREVVERVIPDERTRERARESIHEQILVEIAIGKRKELPPYFNVNSDRHPAVSVVDIDQDGWDDLYLMVQFGRNQLLRNRGDGTFEDIAPRLGLDIQDHCSCGVFGDFDNDGDADLFLGRSLRPSRYLVNENGRFVDRSRDLVHTPLPYLVHSLSAADYNGDGLLDVHFATSFDLPTSAEYEKFLTPEQARAMKQLVDLKQDHDILARLGPPNLLLVNLGQGRFDVAPENGQIQAWRNTLQATWGDFDGDGDPDLYLANDFSINTMFRNDGPEGFVDVTDATGTADIGFGMGASFGDYDNDGRQDLYVANMYSKAGRRITARFETLDKRFAQMARGNSLFRNLGGRFEKVSGLKPPKLLVEKVGWSWAGQFTDVNNDGYLDVYVLSGYYTAPKEVAEPLDL